MCVADFISYFSTKTYGMGTQKNSLNETVLLSTQNTCLNMFKLMDFKTILILRWTYLLNWPYDYSR